MYKSMNFLAVIIIIIILLTRYTDHAYGNSHYIQHAQVPNYYNYYQQSTQIEPAQYIYYYYHPQQAHMYLPPGSYYDHKKGMLQPFPGGGTPIFVDYYKRCSRNFLGIKAHPVLPQYYYVCKIDSVIFGKCHNLQIFNSTINQCVLQPIPDYISNCKVAGRYPIYSDCHIYYKCNKDLKMKIFICPTNMIFSPNDRMCVMGNQCIRTQITINDTRITETTSEDFPICLQVGTYRSPIDCSLYYKCEMQPNGIFLQIRYKCPQDMFYDSSKGKCLPKHKVLCDCVPVALYTTPLSLSMHFAGLRPGAAPRPVPLPLSVQQSLFDSDTLEDASYTTEAIIATEMPNGVGGMNSSENIGVHSSTLTPLEHSISSLDNIGLNNITHKTNYDGGNDGDQDKNAEEGKDDDPINSEGFLTVTYQATASTLSGFSLNPVLSTKPEYIDEVNSADGASGDGPIEISLLQTTPEQITTTEIKTLTTISPNFDKDDKNNKNDEDKDENSSPTKANTTEIMNRVANNTDTHKTVRSLEMIDTTTTTTIQNTNTLKEFNGNDFHEKKENVDKHSMLETEYIQVIPNKRYTMLNEGHLSKKQIWPAVRSDKLMEYINNGNTSKHLTENKTDKDCLCKTKQYLGYVPMSKNEELESAPTQHTISTRHNKAIAFEPMNQRVQFNENIEPEFIPLKKEEFLPILPQPYHRRQTLQSNTIQSTTPITPTTSATTTKIDKDMRKSLKNDLFYLKQNEDTFLIYLRQRIMQGKYVN